MLGCIIGMDVLYMQGVGKIYLEWEDVDYSMYKYHALRSVHSIVLLGCGQGGLGVNACFAAEAGGGFHGRLVEGLLVFLGV